MSNDIIQRISRIDNKVSDAQQRVDRAKGSTDQILATLKDKHGITSIDQARTKRKSKIEKRDKLHDRLTQKVTEFENEFEI